MKNNSKHNNSLELIDINKLIDGLNEKLISINDDEFDEIINNAIFKPSVKSDHNKKTININDVTFDNGAKLGDEINSLTKEFTLLQDIIKSIELKHRNNYDDLDNKYVSLDKRIDNYLLPIDDLKKEIKSLKFDVNENDMLLGVLQKDIKVINANQKNDYNSLDDKYNLLYDNIDSLKDKINTSLAYDKKGKVISIKHLRSEVDAINHSLMNKYGMIDANKLKDRIDVLNDKIASLNINDNNLMSLLENSDVIKSINDDISEIQSDMEYKVHENDIDDKINDSSYFHDLESKVEDLEAYSNDRVELSYVESIDARLNRVECGFIGRLFNSVKHVFNTLKSVRISIKTK
tara:strand:- start:2865 stop:3908 length:1044 start_codon:yes stop_codon:yes gene_type:complete